MTVYLNDSNVFYLNFEHLDFEFFSDFEFGISDEYFFPFQLSYFPTVSIPFPGLSDPIDAKRNF